MDRRFPNIWPRPVSVLQEPTIRGAVRVAEVVINHYLHGESLEILASRYNLPVVLLSEALEFYGSHKELIDAHIGLDRAIEKFFERHAQKLPPDPLRKWIKHRAPHIRGARFVT